MDRGISELNVLVQNTSSSVEECVAQSEEMAIIQNTTFVDTKGSSGSKMTKHISLSINQMTNQHPGSEAVLISYELL